MQTLNSIHEIAEFATPSLNGRTSPPPVPHDTTFGEESPTLTLAEMQSRVAELRNYALMQESIPGSGFHDNDRYPARADLFMAPQRNGWPRKSDNLVHFTGDDAIIFIGPHAVAALATLQSWHADNVHRDPWDLATNGTEMKMVRYIPKLSFSYEDSTPILSLRRDRWNDYLYVLLKMRIGLTGTPLTRS